MSITDELRKWGYGFCGDTHDVVTAIADRIDAEYQKAEDEWRVKNGDMWLKGYNVYRKELMEGNPVIVADLENAGWVRLPVDADGEVIHVGDELDVGFVARIVITDDEWPSYLYAYKETPHILTQHFCNEVSHYHAPTVEDVLREMLEQAVGYSDAHTTVALNAIAEYSAKLRLAGDGEEQ